MVKKDVTKPGKSPALRDDELDEVVGGISLLGTLAPQKGRDKEPDEKGTKTDKTAIEKKTNPDEKPR